MLYFATTEDQFPLYGLEHVHQEIGHIIAVFREESRVEEPGSDAPSTQIPVDPTISVERRASRKEGRGLGRRRQPVPAATEPVSFPQPRSDMTGWFRPPGGMCPIYYGPPVHPDYPSQPGTSQPPADTQTQTPYQASPVSMAPLQSTPGQSSHGRSLQSTPGQSSHGRSPGGTSDDWDQLFEDLSFDPDSLGDFPDPDYQPSQVTPSPRRIASSSTYHPGTAAYDFMQAASDDFQLHCAQQVPPPSSDLVMYSTPPPPADPVIVSTPPAPIRPPPADRPREDPWEAASRRILPHRYARAKKWPKFS